MSSETILLVDDDPDVRAYVSQVLWYRGVHHPRGG